ncbi:MAG: EF-P beta-lysylation protein EpmB [Planctomycetota bacterium]|nr:MAG: EF-P beta-lysylation protein EpmB [Planctomycetota bacterium]
MPNSLTSAASWREEFAQAVREVDELWRLLDLPVDDLPGARAAAEDFPLMVPRPYLSRIRKGDLQDPLLLQMLPQGRERDFVPGYDDDPVGESLATCQPGLLRKYHGRALMICTSACAIHCRYCFRRHYPYAERPRGPAWWQPALAAIAADPSVEEIILSGGDPLTLPDSELAAIAQAAALVPGLKRLRIHTRLPIMIPQRVCPELLAWLSDLPLQAVMVLHANHPNEVDAEVTAACRRLTAAGIPLLNQAVLLGEINDSASVQLALGERLLAAGVIPYYLHVLDRVAGAAHFARSDDQAQALMAELHRIAPGYLVPRLVREVPGETGKRWLWPMAEN